MRYYKVITMKIKIIRIGNSRGIILPKQLLDKFNLKDGHPLYLSISDNPMQIVLRPAESEAEVVGIGENERKNIDRFLELYGHLIRRL